MPVRQLDKKEIAIQRKRTFVELDALIPFSHPPSPFKISSGNSLEQGGWQVERQLGWLKKNRIVSAPQPLSGTELSRLRTVYLSPEILS